MSAGQHLIPGGLICNVTFVSLGYHHKEELADRHRSLRVMGGVKFLEMPNTNPPKRAPPLFETSSNGLPNCYAFTGCCRRTKY